MKTILTSVILLLLIVSTYAYMKSGGTSEVKSSTELSHACDVEAAHPDDILRHAPGKADTEVVPVLALRACTAAVKQFPNEARFHFQLGRALAAMKRVDEAAKEYETAASMGYSPAKFYQAEAILDSYWKSGSETDYEKAVHILEEAKESFDPAAKRYKQVVYNPEGFQNPRIIDALYMDDFERLNRARILVALYGLGMQEFLSTEWNPEDNDCPGYLIDPTINFDLDAAIAGDPRNTLERVGYDLIFVGAEWAGKLILDPTWKGDPTKWRDYYKSLGRRDGQFLAREFGCGSPITKKLYNSLVQFAKAKRPLADYAEDLSKGSGKELFLVQAEQVAEEQQEQPEVSH